jgi:hypothetical protein
MLLFREVLGAEHIEKFGGPVCKSGPLGGDAALVAQVCAAIIGAIFFFQDPMSSYPHSADIDCLNRQTNVAAQHYGEHKPIQCSRNVVRLEASLLEDWRVLDDSIALLQL